MSLTHFQRTSRLLLGVGLVLASCTSTSGGTASTPEPAATAETPETVDTGDTGDTGEVAESATTTDPSAPRETSDPTVISRRTGREDVLLLPEGVELPPNYSQAAVPVDAFASTSVVISAGTDVAVPVEPVAFPPGAQNVGDAVPSSGIIDVTIVIRSCRLVAAWVLPHPDEIVVGYEEYPELTCVTPLDHSMTFDIPATGNNSEGEWSYGIVPRIETLRKVGPTD